MIVLWVDGLLAQNAPVSTIGTVYSIGTEAVVPITVQNFVNISGCNIKIGFDPEMVELSGVTIGSEVFPKGAIDINTSVPGQVYFQWYGSPSATLPDGTVAFNLHFSKKETGSSPLTFIDDNNSRSCRFYYYDKDGMTNYLLNDDPYSSFYVNGYVGFVAGTSPTAYLPVLSAICKDEVVEFPFKVNGFDRIGSVFLEISFDPGVLTGASLENSSGLFSLTLTEKVPGTVLVTGQSTDIDGLSLPDSSQLFLLRFDYHGGTTDLSFVHNLQNTTRFTGPAPMFYPLNDHPKNQYFIDGGILGVPEVVLNVPAGKQAAACLSQSEIQQIYEAWLMEVKYSGGLDLVVTNNAPAMAPDKCGGITVVSWTAVSACEGTIMKEASFSVPEAPPVMLIVPSDFTGNNFNSQTAADIIFADWLNSAILSGGCGATMTNNSQGAPDFCGGTTLVTWEVISECGQNVSKSASFTITEAVPIATDDVAETFRNHSVEIDILANDKDCRNSLQTGSVMIVQSPSNGTASTDGVTGIATYTPSPGFSGTDRFTYRVCNQAGNCVEASVTIVVEQCILFVPEGFSPNSDGINDYFRIDCLQDNYPDARLEVYNRWGNLLYQKDQYGNEDRWGTNEAWWDGSPNRGLAHGREKLPMGTYFYILYKNDGSEPIKGSVYLHR